MKRRTFIKNSSLTALGVSVFGTIQWNGKRFVGDSPTTTDILGPFYRPGAPMRSNIIPAGSNGSPLNLSGIVFKDDGKTPLRNALVEIWQCDEKEYYDNISDDYLFRGAQNTGPNGKYEFKTILPVPYKANATDESSWRPAHIHMRVSVPDQQDLITQLYFKGDKYVDKDPWSSSPQAENRVLTVNSGRNGEREVSFDVVMNKEFPLDPDAFRKITGIYRVNTDLIEFKKMGDLLFVKFNGQFVASLRYIGSNTFEEKIEQARVTFELMPNGITKANIDYAGQKMKGEKILKYSD
jgi:catechol 1,2-dioxygenase